MKIDRSLYIRKKRTLALRQPAWARVLYSSLSLREYTFEQLMEKSSDVDKAEAYKFLSERKVYLEFHINFLGSEVEGIYDTCNGSSARRVCVFGSMKQQPPPANIFMILKFCMCNRQVRLKGQDGIICRAFAREGNDWATVTNGLHGLRQKTEYPQAR